MYAHLAFGFWLLAPSVSGFWLVFAAFRSTKSLICVLFAAVWSNFVCPFGFWLLAPSVSGFWLVFCMFGAKISDCVLFAFGGAHLFCMPIVAFGFWLLAPSVSGFWLVFAAFWSPNL